MSGIIWLASYPKSGNTWLRVFIENLFRNSLAPANINDLRIVKYTDNSYSLYEKVVGRQIKGASDSDLHKYRKAVQGYLGNQPETVFAKTHNALLSHDGTPLIYLENVAGAVYLLRNPFDMVVSFSDHYRVTIDEAIEAIASPHHRINTTEQGIFQILGGWSAHHNSWFGVENFNPLFIRYEDMVRSPAKTFGKFMKFLGLPKNPERLKRAIRHSSFNEVAQQEKQHGFGERSRPDQKFFRMGKIGSYRTVLSEIQIAKIIEAHADLLFEKGYIGKDGKPKL